MGLLMTGEKFHFVTELARAWPELSRADRAVRFQMLSREEADEFFVSLSAKEQANLLGLLPQDEHEDLLALLTEARQTDVLEQLLPERPEHTLRVHRHYARLRPEMTADQAIAELRRQVGQVESITYAYAVDER